MKKPARTRKFKMRNGSTVTFSGGSGAFSDGNVQPLQELFSLLTDLGTMLDTPGYPETTHTQPTPPQSQP